MSKPPDQIEMELAEFLVFGGRVVAEPTTRVPEPATRVTKRPRRMPARPSMVKDTTLEVPGRSGPTFTLVLRPAQMGSSYDDSSAGIRTVMVAKRSEDTWLVLTKAGRYLGVLQEGSGREPWAVSQLAESTTFIGDKGVRVRAHLLTGETWHEALAHGARVWWAP